MRQFQRVTRCALSSRVDVQTLKDIAVRCPTPHAVASTRPIGPSAMPHGGERFARWHVTAGYYNDVRSGRINSELAHLVNRRISKPEQHFGTAQVPSRRRATHGGG